MATKNLRATTVASLSDIARGELIELPGWTEEKPLVARLRRASLTGMIRAGKIPNPLIGAAQRLYEGARSRATADFGDAARVMRIVVHDALVEPSEDALEEAGIELTEQQVDAIYLYAIQGPRALERFRLQQSDHHADPSGDAEPGETEQSAGD